MTCRCFSLCSAAEAVHFLATRPAVITSPDSPWFGYLAHVYGKAPVLPFQLSQLNFFYHRDSNWPAHIEWPMAPCLASAARPKSHVRAPVQPGPACPEEACARWGAGGGGSRRGSGSDDTTQGGRHESRRVVIVIFPNGRYEHRYGGSTPTRGTAIYERPTTDITAECSAAYGQDLNTFEKRWLSDRHLPAHTNWSWVPARKAYLECELRHMAQRYVGRSTATDGSWAEVMRMSERVLPGNLLVPSSSFSGIEGEEDFGCWFYAARGSGVWVNVGRTWRQNTKDTQVLLDRQYFSRFGASAEKYYRPNRTHVSGFKKFFESFPRRAAALGFNSVQLQFKTIAQNRVDPFAELVFLATPGCMARRGSGLPPLRTCTPLLDLRVGADPAALGPRPQPCVCDDDSSYSLNCAGSAGHRGPQAAAELGPHGARCERLNLEARTKRSLPGSR